MEKSLVEHQAELINASDSDFKELDKLATALVEINPEKFNATHTDRAMDALLKMRLKNVADKFIDIKSRQASHKRVSVSELLDLKAEIALIIKEVEEGNPVVKKL